MSDLIRRQSVIDLIDEYMDNCIELHYLPTGEGIKTLIFALPSAQPTIGPVKWIPCKERRPHFQDRVLVWVKGVGARVGYLDLWRGRVIVWVVGDDHYCREKFDQVEAWMPLTEPWRGEEDGKQ